MREKSRKVLNRIIRVSSSGWEHEAEQRHAEVIIKTVNVERASLLCTSGEEESWTKGAKERGTVDGGQSGRIQGLGGEGKISGV